MTMTEGNELKVGTKYGASKPQPSLVPYDAIAWLARVLEYGAAKYARGNWQKLDSEADRIKLLDALERHVGEFKNGLANGEKLTLDVESRMPTIAHVLCNAAFLTFFVVRDGISGSNPLELTAEQRQALADAKALGLRLAHEAKMKECDKLDAGPDFVCKELSKIARVEKIERERFDGFPTFPGEVASLRAELAECREQLRQSEINALRSLTPKTARQPVP